MVFDKIRTHRTGTDSVEESATQRPGAGRKAGYAAVVGLAVLGTAVVRRVRRRYRRKAGHSVDFDAINAGSPK